MSVTLRFLVDEDFDHDIVRGLLQRLPILDIVRGQDTELSRTPGPIVLDRAVQDGHVLLTHDVSTMTAYCLCTGR